MFHRLRVGLLAIFHCCKNRPGVEISVSWRRLATHVSPVDRPALVVFWILAQLSSPILLLKKQTGNGNGCLTVPPNGESNGFWLLRTSYNVKVGAQSKPFSRASVIVYFSYPTCWKDRGAALDYGGVKVDVYSHRKGVCMTLPHGMRRFRGKLHFYADSSTFLENWTVERILLSLLIAWPRNGTNATRCRRDHA